MYLHNYWQESVRRRRAAAVVAAHIVDKPSSAMAQLDISSSVVDASAFIIVGTSRLCKGDIKQLSHVFCSTNIFICISLNISVCLRD